MFERSLLKGWYTRINETQESCKGWSYMIKATCNGLEYLLEWQAFVMYSCEAGEAVGICLLFKVVYWVLILFSQHKKIGFLYVCDICCKIHTEL